MTQVTGYQASSLSPDVLTVSYDFNLDSVRDTPREVTSSSDLVNIETIEPLPANTNRQQTVRVPDIVIQHSSA